MANNQDTDHSVTDDIDYYLVEEFPPGNRDGDPIQTSYGLNQLTQARQHFDQTTMDVALYKVVNGNRKLIRE
jgi:hypothetical protein